MKLYCYELRRLIWNKFFLGLLAVTLFYGWQVLNSVTLLGIAHTAPFSPWSFGDYLSRILPLLWVGALFFLTFFTSRSEGRTRALTAATPIRPQTHALIRCTAALTGTLLLSLAALLLAGIFYGSLFHWYDWGSLLLPTLLLLPPTLLFALGSGWAIGRLRPWLLFLWMFLPFLLMALPLPAPLSILNGSIFTDRPLALGTLDPAFSLPLETILLQCGVLLAGVVLLIRQPVKKH